MKNRMIAGMFFAVLSMGMLSACGVDENETAQTDTPGGMVSDVVVNTTVRATGQYPEEFVVTLTGKPKIKKPNPESFHITGEAGGWQAKETHSFSAGFLEAKLKGNTLTLVPKDFPESTTAVLALCPALGYSRNSFKNLEKMKDVPVYFCHAKNDGTIAASTSETAAKILESVGAADVNIKIFSDDEMNAVGASPDNNNTYSYHHVELAVMSVDTYMEWLYSNSMR